MSTDEIMNLLRGYGDDARDRIQNRKMILVDSCVVIDVLENDRKWADWSQAQRTWSARGPLLINPVICGAGGLRPKQGVA
jgi:hypothetical protein